ncbi:hypothetical protein O976_00240 [Mycobacterium avium subsp. paratuberculosis 10-8425]|nr:hypothetical protein O977_00240 [Mycobacterium avium subsp. paratuberculosis 10-5975]ETB45216.1 hypothetical protein O975_00265 [Mycobacterium avium subsp. paratuberculosis 11-1786]ETB55201.1 hypothetical protein O976_00240 [Mycobacterium avium subsp. paratuberculosis 10-8425]
MEIVCLARVAPYGCVTSTQTSSQQHIVVRVLQFWPGGCLAGLPSVDPDMPIAVEQRGNVVMAEVVGWVEPVGFCLFRVNVGMVYDKECPSGSDSCKQGLLSGAPRRVTQRRIKRSNQVVAANSKRCVFECGTHPVHPDACLSTASRCAC